MGFDASEVIRRLEKLSLLSLNGGDGHWGILFLYGAQSVCDLLDEPMKTNEKKRIENLLNKIYSAGVSYDGWTNMYEWFGCVVEWREIRFAPRSKCWLCGQREAESNFTFTQEMQKEIFNGYKIKLFSRRTILVPRCAACMEVISKANNWFWLAPIIGIGLGAIGLSIFGGIAGFVGLVIG